MYFELIQGGAEAPPATLASQLPSPGKGLAGAWQVTACAGLCMVDLLPHAAVAAHAAYAEVDLACITVHGAQLLGLFDLVAGQRLPQAEAVLAWPDAATREAGWAAHACDAAVHTARAAEQQAHGAQLVGKWDAYMLRPAAYAPPRGLLV